MAVIVVGDVEREAVALADRAALLGAHQPVAGAAAAQLRRPGKSRHALRRRHRQGNDRHDRADLQSAAGAQPGHGRRLSRASCSISCSARCSARGSPSRRRARTRRFSTPLPSATFPGAEDARQAVAQALVSNEGVTRGLEALADGSPARRPLRLHRLRARSREAGEHGGVRARRRGEPGPGIGEPRRRVHAQLPAGRSAADDLAGARVPPPVLPGDHARRDQRARRRLVPGAQPADRRQRAGSGRYRDAHRGAARSRPQVRLRKNPPGVRGRRRGAKADGHAAGARQHRPDDRPAGGRHHRVDAVERRHRGAEADDAQGGPDSVPRIRARRHLAGERRRLRRRRAPRTTYRRRQRGRKIQRRRAR